MTTGALSLFGESYEPADPPATDRCPACGGASRRGRTCQRCRAIGAEAPRLDLAAPTYCPAPHHSPSTAAECPGDCRPIRWAIVTAEEGAPTVARGECEPDPNRGDPMGAVADDVRGLAMQHADRTGGPVDWRVWRGTSSHSGTVVPERFRHPFTVTYDPSCLHCRYARPGDPDHTTH